MRARLRPINQEKRRIVFAAAEGGEQRGFLRRVWQGDCWRWETYDEGLRRLPGLARSRTAALAKLAQREEEVRR